MVAACVNNNNQSHGMLAGIDEAGRGALAGPLLVACVGGLPTGAEWIDELRDSKRLSPAKRERLFTHIQRDCDWVDTERVEAEEVDRVNILQATLGGMAALLDRVRDAKDVARVVVDGDVLPETATGDTRIVALVKADDAVREAMAASIVAKVTRDRIMALHGDQRFSFARHKGYGTKAHYAELREHGPTTFHRKSFNLRSSGKLPFIISETATLSSVQ